jgi:hypothetical protein
MNRLSSTVFGQLFYLRDGQFTQKGLPHAVKSDRGLYTEQFSVGSMKHSTLHFLYRYQPHEVGSQLFIQSIIVLGGKYREFYRFDASPTFGAHEKYSLSLVEDGWITEFIKLEQLEPLLSVLKQSQHIVHDSNL